MKNTTIYSKGNNWQKNRYSFMSEFNRTNGVTSFGNVKENGNFYYHIIDLEHVDPEYNLLGEKLILDEVKKRFKTKAGDKRRVLTNTVASQPCCFNLFAPLKLQQNAALTDRLFSRLLGKVVNVEDIIIEFTPDEEESLGDQSKTIGTDADVSVFYTDSDKRTGIILIEFKYIEPKFSLCTSYAKKNRIRNVCDSQNFHDDKLGIIDKTKPDCGYLRYNNWELTQKSNVISIDSIKQSSNCPFRFSANQLWRNMLLAENVARVRNLSEFHFWVLAPKHNTFLWNNHGENIEKEFKTILTVSGNLLFRRLDIEHDFILPLEMEENNNWVNNWLQKFREKYLTDIHE